jgi:hypothetical protein
MHVPWPWLRQTEDGSGVTGGSIFLLNAECSDADFLAVYDEPHAPLNIRIPFERRILFIGEPPSVKVYPQSYLNQFGCIVSPFPLAAFRGRQEVHQSCLPWHYGVNFHQKNVCNEALSLADLLTIIPPEKTEELSLICSTKIMTPEHRRRLKFVKELERVLGDRIAVFGRGFREIGDKSDAILPYKYHIVLENNEIDNFWTEKTADAFLGYSLPLFSGCANLESYFSANSFRRLDLNDIPRAIAAVQKVLEKDPYQESLSAIVDSRSRILGPYNLFNYLDALTDSIDQVIVRKSVSQTILRPSSRWQRCAGKLFSRLVSRISSFTCQN